VGSQILAPIHDTPAITKSKYGISTYSLQRAFIQTYEGNTTNITVERDAATGPAELTIEWEETYHPRNVSLDVDGDSQGEYTTEDARMARQNADPNFNSYHIPTGYPPIQNTTMSATAGYPINQRTGDDLSVYINSTHQPSSIKGDYIVRDGYPITSKDRRKITEGGWVFGNRDVEFFAWRDINETLPTGEARLVEDTPPWRDSWNFSDTQVLAHAEYEGNPYNEIVFYHDVLPNSNPSGPPYERVELDGYKVNKTIYGDNNYRGTRYDKIYTSGSVKPFVSGDYGTLPAYITRVGDDTGTHIKAFRANPTQDLIEVDAEVFKKKQDVIDFNRSRTTNITAGVEGNLTVDLESRVTEEVFDAAKSSSLLNDSYVDYEDTNKIHLGAVGNQPANTTLYVNTSERFTRSSTFSYTPGTPTEYNVVAYGESKHNENNVGVDVEVSTQNVTSTTQIDLGVNYTEEGTTKWENTTIQPGDSFEKKFGTVEYLGNTIDTGTDVGVYVDANESVDLNVTYESTASTDGLDVVVPGSEYTNVDRQSGVARIESVGVPFNKTAPVDGTTQTAYGEYVGANKVTVSETNTPFWRSAFTYDLRNATVETYNAADVQGEIQRDNTTVATFNETLQRGLWGSQRAKATEDFRVQPGNYTVTTTSEYMPSALSLLHGQEDFIPHQTKTEVRWDRIGETVIQVNASANSSCSVAGSSSCELDLGSTDPTNMKVSAEGSTPIYLRVNYTARDINQPGTITMKNGSTGYRVPNPTGDYPNEFNQSGYPNGTEWKDASFTKQYLATAESDFLNNNLEAQFQYETNILTTKEPKVEVINSNGEKYTENLTRFTESDGTFRNDSIDLELPSSWFAEGQNYIRVSTEEGYADVEVQDEALRQQTGKLGEIEYLPSETAQVNITVDQDLDQQWYTNDTLTGTLRIENSTDYTVVGANLSRNPDSGQQVSQEPLVFDFTYNINKQDSENGLRFEYTVRDTKTDEKSTDSFEIGSENIEFVEPEIEVVGEKPLDEPRYTDETEWFEFQGDPSFQAENVSVPQPDEVERSRGA
jgi:hypothetical protein